MNPSVRELTTTALLTAILCILGPITLPVGIVPLSLTSLGIYLAIILFEKRESTVSVLLYLLIGLAGIPVFSGFSSGPGKLLGPTGGYLLGYIALAGVGSWCKEKRKEKGDCSLGLSLGLGTLCLYLVGTGWLVVQTGLNPEMALMAGVIPFIPGDILKIWVAILLGKAIKKRLNSSFFTKV